MRAVGAGLDLASVRSNVHPSAPHHASSSQPVEDAPAVVRAGVVKLARMGGCAHGMHREDTHHAATPVRAVQLVDAGGDLLYPASPWICGKTPPGEGGSLVGPQQHEHATSAPQRAWWTARASPCGLRRAAPAWAGAAPPQSAA